MEIKKRKSKFSAEEFECTSIQVNQRNYIGGNSVNCTY